MYFPSVSREPNNSVQMGFEELEPIFSEPKVEWAGEGSAPSSQFLLYVHGADPSHLRIVVTDLHLSTWEAVLSVLQLEDMVNLFSSLIFLLPLFGLYTSFYC